MRSQWWIVATRSGDKILERGLAISVGLGRSYAEETQGIVVGGWGLRHRWFGERVLGVHCWRVVEGKQWRAFIVDRHSRLSG